MLSEIRRYHGQGTIEDHDGNGDHGNKYRRVPGEDFLPVEDADRNEIERGDHGIDLEPHQPDKTDDLQWTADERGCNNHHRKGDAEQEVCEGPCSRYFSVLFPGQPAGIDDRRPRRGKHDMDKRREHHCHEEHDIVLPEFGIIPISHRRELMGHFMEDETDTYRYRCDTENKKEIYGIDLPGKPGQDDGEGECNGNSEPCNCQVETFPLSNPLQHKVPYNKGCAIPLWLLSV